jgi:arginine/lysine/ornithine decarboxylase
MARMRVNSKLMNECFARSQSTSPSFKIIRSVENAYLKHVHNPEQSIGAADRLSRELRIALSGIKGTKLLNKEHLKNKWGNHIQGLDPWKLQIALIDYECTGYQLNSDLQNYNRIFDGIVPEKAGPRSLTFISTIRSARYCDIYCELKSTRKCSQCAGVAGEVKIAMEAILSNKLRKPNPYHITPPFMHQHETIARPSKILYGKREFVPLNEAAGRICAEVMVPYPPGYPPVIPGQRITGNDIQFLKKIKELGGEIMAIDSYFEKISVSKEV